MRLMIIGILAIFVTTLMIHADDLLEKKRTLKGNSTEVYNVLPPEVDNLSDMFTAAVFYGRLRFNSFVFDWDEEIEGIRKDHYTMGVGGSLIYKSAYLHGFGVTAGLYTTQNPWHMDDEDVIYYKVGKGVLSRYDVATEGQYGLTSLAQAYLEYKNEKISLKIGRQIFESRMTKSNDIKTHISVLC